MNPRFRTGTEITKHYKGGVYAMPPAEATSRRQHQHDAQQRAGHTRELRRPAHLQNQGERRFQTPKQNAIHVLPTLPPETHAEITGNGVPESSDQSAG